MAEPLTPLDIGILDEIQADATLSTVDLAARVGLSQSPCWRRLQRMKELGYVRREVAILDPARFGPSILIYAKLKIGTPTEDDRQRFRRKLEVTPEIMECYTLFGETDIIMKVHAVSIAWYQRFHAEVLKKLPAVVSVQSSVALGTLKRTTALPVREALPR